MPSSKNYVRDYQHEYAIESPERREARAMRKQARRDLVKKYGERALEGKDVGHRLAISRGGTNALSNLEVQSPRNNRSFSRTKSGAMKSERSRKGY